MANSVLPERCSLYVNVKYIRGWKNDSEDVVDLFVTVNAAAQKHQTRTVKKGQPLEWRELFTFGEDILLQGGRLLSIAVCSKGRFSSNSVVASGTLQLPQLRKPGSLTAAAVQLHPPNRPSTSCGTLLLELSALRTASALPAGVLECFMPKAPSSCPFAAASAAVALSPEVTVIPPGAPPRVLHCAAGTVYEEPCMLFLRVTLHSASGLRNHQLGPSHGGSSLSSTPGRHSISAASQRASQHASSLKSKFATRLGIHRSKTPSTPDQPPPAPPEPPFRSPPATLAISAPEPPSDTPATSPPMVDQPASDPSASLGTPGSPGGSHSAAHLVSVVHLWKAAAAHPAPIAANAASPPQLALLMQALPVQQQQQQQQPAQAPQGAALAAAAAAMAAVAAAPVPLASTMTQPGGTIATPAPGLILDGIFEAEDGLADQSQDSWEEGSMLSFGEQEAAAGGTHFFYVKAGYEGQSWVSTMAQQEGEAAQFGQSFLLAVQRPLPATPLLELDLISRDARGRSRQACRFRIPLASLQPTPLGAPPALGTFRASVDQKLPWELQLSTELVDADPRAAFLALPLSVPPPDPIAPIAPSHPSPIPTKAPSASSPPSPTASQPQPIQATPTDPTASSLPAPGAIQSSPAPPPQAVLHLMISSFDLMDPASGDCYFVVKLGNLWCCSTPRPATLPLRWDWELHLPITDPSALVTIGLFRAADQNAAKKVVQATRSKVWTDSAARSIGRLRIRPTTLLPGKLCCCRLPLHADRTMSNGGATVAHVSLAMHVQHGSAAACVRQYWRPPVFWLSAHLGRMQGVQAEALEQARQKIAFRWLEECAPPLPSRIARRMADDGRQEFSLSRTKQNWRRIAAVAALVHPLGEYFNNVRAWSSPLLSGAVTTGVVLLAVYPSRVIAVGIFALVLQLCTTAYREWARGRYGMLLPMAEDLQVRADDGELAVAPLDPYTALKQNYDALVAFSMKLQNVLDSIASQVECCVSLLSCHDPVATLQFIALLSLVALLFWTVGIHNLLCAAVLWALRPPALRRHPTTPHPPRHVSFLSCLPRRSDAIL